MRISSKSQTIKGVIAVFAFSFFLCLLLFLPVFGQTALQPSLKLISCAPYPELSTKFICSRGWTGADGAYSVQLSKDLALWLFGDTLIGQVVRGRRRHSTMINNSAAWQFLRESARPFQYFWSGSESKPESLVAAARPDTWIWPGDCALVDDKLYIFLHVLSRIHRRKLAKLDMTGWEYFCQAVPSETEAPAKWLSAPLNPLVLIDDGAPEMTVSRVRGLSGFFATYFASGIGFDVLIRHAQHPEGPWSKAEIVYHCPSQRKDSFYYSAKAHPELSENDGELVITYCENCQSLESNMENAQIYAPKALPARLKLLSDQSGEK